MQDLANIVYQSLSSVEGQIFLAISGGVDSMVLMDVCSLLYQQEKIKRPIVLHVNHHLHQDADAWQDLVEKEALKRQLGYQSFSIHLDKTAIEETARHKRYQNMFSVLESSDVLLSAHHLEDQKEGFLFRAFRGSSLKGLVGMSERTQLFSHTVIRPFYKTPKVEILEYAKKHQLNWVEDPSNLDTQYRRNEIRKALSKIKDTDNFALTLHHLQKEYAVFSRLRKEQLAKVLPMPHVLSIGALNEQPKQLQQLLFHDWLESFSFSLSASRTDALFQAMIQASEDRYPQEVLGDYTLLRYQDVLSLLVLPENFIRVESNDEWIDLGKIGKIKNPKKDAITVEPLGHNKGQYKKKLQSRNIPAWLRVYIPLVDGKLIFDTQYQWYPNEKWLYWLGEPSS